MEIDAVKIVQEVERQFPKELMICVQAIQIRSLQEQVEDKEEEEE